MPGVGVAPPQVGVQRAGLDRVVRVVRVRQGELLQRLAGGAVTPRTLSATPGQATRRQGLPLRRHPRLAASARHHTPHRLPGSRHLGATQPPPMEDRTQHRLALRLSQTDRQIRARGLPPCRLPRPRGSPDLLQEARQDIHMRHSLSIKPHRHMILFRVRSLPNYASRALIQPSASGGPLQSDQASSMRDRRPPPKCGADVHAVARAGLLAVSSVLVRSFPVHPHGGDGIDRPTTDGSATAVVARASGGCPDGHRCPRHWCRTRRGSGSDPGLCTRQALVRPTRAA